MAYYITYKLLARNLFVHIGVAQLTLLMLPSRPKHVSTNETVHRRIADFGRNTYE